MSGMRILREVVLGFFLMVALMLTTLAYSGEKIVNLPIQSVTTALDVNGNQYSRVIVTEKSKIEGIEYELGVPCMLFGKLSSAAKGLSEGDMFKAVVAEREFQGRKSYTVLSVLK